MECFIYLWWRIKNFLTTSKQIPFNFIHENKIDLFNSFEIYSIDTGIHLNPFWIFYNNEIYGNLPPQKEKKFSFKSYYNILKQLKW